MKKHTTFFRTPKAFLLGACSLFAVSTLVYSCKKESPTEMPDKSNAMNLSAVSRSGPALSVINGRLVFATSGDFEAQMQNIQNMTDADRLIWSNAQTGFTSVLAAYDQADNNANNGQGITADSMIRSHRMMDVPDYAFATVLSSNGLLQIDDSIYVYTISGDIYAVPEAYENQIADGSYLNLAGVRKMTAAGNTPEGNCNWFDNNREIYKLNNGNDFPQHNGRRVRWVVTKWNSWWGVYSSCGYRLKMQKDTRFAGWVNNTSPQWFKATSGWEGLAKFINLPPAPRNEPVYTQTNSGQLYLTRTMVWYGGVATPQLCYYSTKFPGFFEVNYGGYASYTWNH